jgi:hypothetical protein
MVIRSWQCPHNCADTATCDCDNLERQLARNWAESEARWAAEIAANYPAYVARIAACARPFLRCHDEFPDDPSACQEWLDALQRAVEGSPGLRYDDTPR